MYWYHVHDYWVSKLPNYLPSYTTKGKLCECIANEKFEFPLRDLKSNSHYRNSMPMLYHWATTPLYTTYKAYLVGVLLPLLPVGGEGHAPKLPPSLLLPPNPPPPLTCGGSTVLNAESIKIVEIYHLPIVVLIILLSIIYP